MSDAITRAENLTPEQFAALSEAIKGYRADGGCTMIETTERATGATDERELLGRALAGEMCADPENIRMETSIMIEELIDAQLAALSENGYRIVQADDVLTEGERQSLRYVVSTDERFGDTYADHITTLRRFVERGGG